MSGNGIDLGKKALKVAQLAMVLALATLAFCTGNHFGLEVLP